MLVVDVEATASTVARVRSGCFSWWWWCACVCAVVCGIERVISYIAASLGVSLVARQGDSATVDLFFDDEMMLCHPMIISHLYVHADLARTHPHPHAAITLLTSRHFDRSTDLPYPSAGHVATACPNAGVPTCYSCGREYPSLY